MFFYPHGKVLEALNPVCAVLLAGTFTELMLAMCSHFKILHVIILKYYISKGTLPLILKQRHQHTHASLCSVSDHKRCFSGARWYSKSKKKCSISRQKWWLCIKCLFPSQIFVLSNYIRMKFTFCYNADCNLFLVSLRTEKPVLYYVIFFIK